MIKNYLIKACAAAAVSIGVFACGMQANAATVDDVAATARRLGFPESVIQQGYNQYYSDPDVYTSDDFDYAIEYLIAYENDLKAQLGITTEPAATDVPSTTAPEQTTTQTAAPTEPEQQGTTSGSGSGSSQTSGGSTSSNSGADNGSAETPGTADSNTDSSQTSVRGDLTESEFINMSLDEKRELISTLSPEEQQQFFNTLSPEELKSIVKQLPTDDKASVIDTFVKAGEAMGVNVTVDNISDDAISMSMRNKDGKLVDVTSVGVIVEDTGYDYRGIIAFSGAALIAAAGVLWLVIRKCFGKNENEAENEQ